MFGSDYAIHPEILIQSLQDMNTQYQNTHRSVSVLGFLQILYIRLFGIPEIGFQIRGMYFRKALRMIPNIEPKKILDAGSGIGSYVYYLARVFPNATIDGWDIDRNKLAFTKKFTKELRMRNVHFSFRDVAKKPKKGGIYDFIVSVDVLEHIRNYKNVLRIFFILLKPGGYAYIHTPQVNQKRFFAPCTLWKHKDHVREGFIPAQLIVNLEEVGFTIVTCDHTFGFFGSLAWEINHFLLARSIVIAGIIYPVLYLLALLDVFISNTYGLASSFVVRKP